MTTYFVMSGHGRRSDGGDQPARQRAGRRVSNRAPGRSRALAAALTDDEWQTRIPADGRTVGVIVHHVASIYPLEIQLAQTLANGKPSPA